MTVRNNHYGCLWAANSRQRLARVVNPFDAHAIMGTAVKHPVPYLVKPSFVIFDIRALTPSPGRRTARCPDVKNYK